MTTNLAMLTTLNEQRRADLEARDRFETQLSEVDRQLSTMEKTLVKVRPVIVAPPPAPKNPLLDDYVKAQSDLNALIGKGQKATHPDVVLAQSALDRIKAKLTPEELASLDHKNDKPPAAPLPDETIPNPAYVNLASLKASLETELKIRRDNLTKTKDEIARYESYIKNAPQSEQEIGEVMLENTDLTKQYHEVKDKLDQAQQARIWKHASRDRSSKSRIRRIFPHTHKACEAGHCGCQRPGQPCSVSCLRSLSMSRIRKCGLFPTSSPFWGRRFWIEIPEIVTLADLVRVTGKRIHLASFAVASAVWCMSLLYLSIRAS